MPELFEDSLHSSLIPTKAASELSGYNADYLARLCREKKIEGTQVGRSWLINRASLEAFVKVQEEKKRERAEELRAARGKEYRKAQKPILRAVRTTATATKEAVVKHVASPREFVPVRSPFIAKARGVETNSIAATKTNGGARTQGAQPTYSRPLAALAVSLAVVAGSAYASTNDGVLRVLSAAPRVALSAADAASPMHLIAYSPLRASDADAFAVAAGDDTTRGATGMADVADARSALALSMPSASGVSGAFASFGAVAIASGVESVHALTDDARAPFDTTESAHAAHARIALVSNAAQHPLATAVRAYVYSGMYAFASGDAFGDAYLSLISRTGDRALAIAAGTRDTIAFGQRASMAVLDGYAHGVYAWNTAAPKAAGTAVMAFYDAGDATNKLAEALPSAARQAKDDLAYGIVDASQAISGAVTNTEAGALAAAFAPFSSNDANSANDTAGTANLASAAAAPAPQTQSVAHTSSHAGALAPLTSLVSVATRVQNRIIETEGALTALPIRAEDTMLGMAGYAASLMDGTESRGLAVRDTSPLPASVAAVLPESWERALEQFFSNSHTLAYAIFSSGFHTLATLLPGGSVVTPALTVVDTSPAETLAFPTPADTVTRPIGGGTYTGGTGSTGPVQNIINNYFPQTIVGGSINDALLAVIKPYVRDSVESALRNVDRNTKDYVKDDGGTLTDVTIKSGDATLATLIADLANITELHVGELTAGTTTLGEVTASSTNINGDLSVTGNITGGSITVSGLSSGGAITAPYFVATDTAATSTFQNVTGTNAIFDTLTASKIGIGTSSPLVSLDISGTDAIRIPVGTTAERPLSSGPGLVRYNTTTHQFEGFGDSGVWQGLGGVIDADQDTYITADTNNANENTLRFVTAGTERMTIGPTGNVGIGTTSPYATLSVGGDLALTGGLYDGNAMRGAPGQILTSTGTGVAWVSTTTFSGSGSGLDADLLDGLDSTYFLANAFSTTSTDYWLGTKTTNDLAEGSNLYYTQARFDAAFAGKSTTNLVEGTNLYFTNVRARTALSGGTGIGYDSATGTFTNTGVVTFNGRTGAVVPSAGDYTTDLVAEGTTNLYYTQARFDAALAGKTTDDLAEGSTNKYYTDTRARLALSESIAGIDYDSSTGIFSLSTGYAIPLSASTTAWQAFYDVPSSRITAGTNLAWSGNTINGPSDSYIRSLFSGTSPIGYDSGTGAFSLSTAGDWSGTFDGHEGAYYLANAFSTTSANVWLTTKTTDDLAEGSTNKYYTDARARGAVSGSSGISYNSTTGVFSLVTSGDWTGTFDGNDSAFYLDRANHTGTQTASTISDFASAARGLFSAQSPLTYSTTTGEFSIGGGSGTVPIESGGTNTNTQTTNGIAYFDGTKITTNANFAYNGSVNLYVDSADTWSTGYNVYKRGTTGNALASVVDGTELGYNSFYGWDGSAYARGAFYIAKTTENWDASSHGSKLAFNTTPNGTTSSIEQMTIDQNGNVGIGSTSPAARLSVEGNGLFNGGITANSATINGTATVQNLAVGSLSGFLKATAGVVGTSLVDLSTDVTSTLPQANGGTGFTSYAPGDVLIADNTGALTKLPAGSAGQVLKIQAGIPAWGADQTTASDGSDGIFATSTGRIYPINTAVITIFGSNATSTQNSILEVHGQEYVSGKLAIGTTSPSSALSVGGNGLFSGNVTAGGALSAASLSLGGSSFTSLLGTGLVNNGGVLSVATSTLGFASATTTAALTSSLANNYVPKWNASANGFNNSLIYDSGTQIGIGTASNLNGALTANGTFSVQAEGDIFRQYDSGDAAWYPVIARYDTNNGTFPGATYIFGAGSNANVGIEKPGGANVVTFHVHADTTTLSNALTVGTTLGVTGTATLGNVIDSGLTANTLAYANGSKQLSSVTVSSPLSFTGGTLSISTTTFSGSGSNFNADLLDGLDSTYFLANSFSTTSANVWLTGKTTDSLAEGSTNKYYTDARARLALSASGPLSYNSSTGAFSLGTVPISKGGTNTTSQTANGIAYFDGTKITTGSDLTYNGSVLVNNGSIESNGQFIGFGGGAASTPSFTFASDLTTGIFNPSNNVIGFATGGIERMRIDPNGKVGVGTTSPSAELSVEGDALINGSVNASGQVNAGTGYYLGGQRLAYASSSVQTAVFGFDAGGGSVSGNTVFGNAALSDVSSGGFAANSNNTAIGMEALWNLDGSFLNGNGNTALGYQAGSGITTGSTNTVLGFSAGSHITTGTGNLIIGANVDAPIDAGNGQLNIGNIIFGTGVDATGKTVDADAKIGIGTSSPAARFAVAGSAYIDGALTATGTTTIGTLNGLLSGANGVVGLANVSSPLSFSGNTLTLSTAGDWTGTFDGQEGSWYVANSFSTTSANAWLGGKSTTNLAEGTNLYFTNARARTALSVSSPLTYNSSTGVFGLGQVPLGTNVSGVLPVANGGTGLGSQTSGGVAYYDGTNITTGSALTFDGTNFATTGNITSGDQFIGTGLGAAASPSYTFASDLTTGVFNPVHNNIGFATGGIERVRIDQNGNLGIGTTSPAYALDVAGDADITGKYYVNGIQALYVPDQSNFTESLFIGNGGTNLAHASGINGQYNTGVGMGALAAITSGFSNAALGDEAMLANTTGSNNTAIGDQALTANVSGSSNVAVGSGALITATGSFNIGIGTNADVLAAGDTNETVIGYGATGNGSNSVTLGNTSVTKTILNGNVGIGTTTPSYMLTIATTSAVATPLYVYNGDYTVPEAIFQGKSSVSTNNGKIRLGGPVYNLELAYYDKDDQADISTHGWLKLDSGNYNALWASQDNVGLSGASPLSTARVQISAEGTTDDLLLLSSTHSTHGDLFTVKNNGNVGIGTTSPMAKLSVAGDAYVTGTLTANGITSTGAVNVLNDFSADSVTVNGFLGPGIVGNTGTGQLYSMATSSLGIALSDTTGTLAIARGGTNATSQSASGVAYFDGTKITSDVSKLEYDGTDLSVWTGNVIGSQFIGGSGNPASIPQFTFQGDETTGIFNPTSNVIGFSTGGIERARLDANGNFGIGTTSPSSALSVEGDALIDGNTTLNGNVGIGSSPMSAVPLRVQSSGGLAAYITTSSSNVDYLSVEHSNGTGYSGPISSVGAGGNTMPAYAAGIYGSNNGTMNYYALLGIRRINSGWYASAPSAVTPGTYLPGIGFAGQAGTIAGSQTLIGASILGIVDDTVTSTALPSAIVFNTSRTNSTGLTERVRITSSGNVGIGTTSPYATLSVAGDLALTGGIYDSTATRGTAGQVLQTTGTGVTWVATSTLGFAPATTGTGLLYGNGSGGFSTANISSPLSFTGGTLSLGTVPIAKGGTNATSQTTNGVAYYDGTKITTDSGLTYNGSALTSNGSIYSNGQFGGFSGSSASIPSFSFNGDFTTGIFNPASSVIGFSTGGVERARLDANGNFGIGTSSPSASLAVEGDALINGAFTATGLSTFTGGHLDFTTPTVFTVPDNETNALTIATSTTGTPLFRIDTTSGSNEVALGTGGGDVTIGYPGQTTNLVFEENATIKGQGTGRTLTFGAGGDVINFAVGTTFTSGLTVSGALNDGAGSAGTAGMVLSSTGTGVNWVATSTLGFQPSNAKLTQIAGLADPNADRILFWDDSAGTYAYLTASTGLSLSGTTLSVGTIPVNKGGTNITSYTTGDLLYASSASALAKLADVATGKVLVSGGVGVAPSWGQVALTSGVSGVLPVANGGTGVGTQTANGVAYYDGTKITTDSGFTYDGTNLAVSFGNVSGRKFVSGSSSGASTPAFTFDGDTTTGIFHPANDVIGFSTGGVERARLDANGNFGIGTSSPSSALSVEGDALINGVLTATGGATLGGTLQVGSNLISNTGSTYGLSLDTAGRGTFTTLSGSVTPGVTVQNTGSSAGSGISIGFKNSTILGASISSVVDASINDTDLVFSNRGSGTLNETLRITSTGRLGIGTTSPTSALGVTGSVDSTAGYKIEGNDVLTYNDGQKALAIGIGAAANGWTDLVVGDGAQAHGHGIAIGGNANASADQSIVIGDGATANASFTTVIGQSLTGFTAASNEIYLGASDNGNVNSRPYSLSLMGQAAGSYNEVPLFRVGTSWLDDAYATRRSQASLYVYDATAAREFLRANTDGSVPTLLLNPSGGNVGIGTTSPSSQLHIDSEVSGVLPIITLSATGGNVVNIGRASAIFGKGTADFGINVPSASNTFFGNGGNVRLTIGSTGNVGIGTTAPYGLLANNSGNPKDGGGSGTGLTAAGGSFNWSINAAGYATGIRNDSTVSNANGLLVQVAGTAATNRVLTVGTTASDLFVVTGAGNVGIGTTTPTSKLQIVNGIAQTTLANVGSGTDSTNIFFRSTASAQRPILTVQNGYGEVFRVDGDGSVGIGTTSPYAKLAVSGDLAVTGGIYDSTASRGTNGMVLLSTGTGTQWVATSTLGISGGGGGGSSYWSLSGSNISYTSGNVGIGTSSPMSALSVVGAAKIKTTTNQLAALSVENAAGQNVFQVDTLDSGGDIFTVASSSGDTYLTVGRGGNVGIGTTSPYAKFAVSGDLAVTGGIYDSTASRGTNGMVLQSTGTGVQWVATSTLGISGGGGSVSNPLILNSTQALYVPNQSTFSGSLFVGDGGANLTHSSSSDGQRNTGVGIDALNALTTGQENTAVGYSALGDNTTGIDNAALGNYALSGNTTGIFNSAFGGSALRNNSTGTANSAFGYNALSGSNGDYNTGLGVQALNNNSTGSQNTAGGFDALYGNTTGSNNTAFGYYAGRFIANGSTANQTSSNSLYLGYQTYPLANGDTNETVIGYGATGNGSNSVTLGNTSVTKTILNGNVGIGSTTPSSKLSVAGDIALTGNVKLQDSAINSDGSASFAGAHGTVEINGSTGMALNVYGGNVSLTGAVSGSNWNINTSGYAEFDGGVWSLGNLDVSGALRDGSFSPGTAGMVLQTTGSGVQWVATSSLGISGGGGGGTNYFTNSGASTYLSTGTNLGIGSTTPSAKLSVSTNTAGYAADFFNDGNSVNNKGIRIQAGHDDSNDAPGYNSTLIQFNTGNGTDAGAIVDETGNAYNALAINSGSGRDLAFTAGGSRGDSSGSLEFNGYLANFNAPVYLYNGLEVDGFGDASFNVATQFNSGIKDGAGSLGTSGMVLQSTGTGVQWVATSTLGISGGGGSGTNYFTNSSATTTLSTGKLLSVPTNGGFGFGNDLFAYASSTNHGTVLGLYAGGDTLTKAGSSYNNTAVGYLAMPRNNQAGGNTAVGAFSLGGDASGDLTGYYNSAFGEDALGDLTSGSANTGIGDGALGILTTGSSNVAIGQNSLDTVLSNANQNVGVGAQIGALGSVGSGNTLLGYQAAYTGVGNNNIIIGQYVDAPNYAGNQQLNIGNLIYGTGVYGGTSDSATPVSGGMVGIGTSSPSYTLDSVANTTTTSDGVTWTTPGAFEGNPGSGPQYANRILFNNTNSTNAQNVLAFAHNGASKWYIGNDYNGNGSQTFAISDATVSGGTARLYIDSTGKIGIGSITPSSELSVATNASGYAADFFNDGNAANRSGIKIQGGLDNNNSAGPSKLIQFNDGDGTDVGNIGFGNGSLEVNLGNSTGLTLGSGIYIASSGETDFIGAGNMFYSGAYFTGDAQFVAGIMDSSGSNGSNGMVLTSTGTGVQWVATSSLGISGGGGGVSNPITLNSTQALYVPNQTNFLDSLFVGDGGTHLTHASGVKGQYNTGVGIGALSAVTSGDSNTGVGASALGALTTGTQNAALGTGALSGVTSGSDNVGLGYYALTAVTSGSYNIGIGDWALGNISTGYNNIAIGDNAGFQTTDTVGDPFAETNNTSVFIGVNTKPAFNGDTNETAIGYNAVGAGSNSVTLGNTSVTKTILNGNVGIGTTSPSQQLTISDNTAYNSDYSQLMIANTGYGSGGLTLAPTGSGYKGYLVQAYGNSSASPGSFAVTDAASSEDRFVIYASGAAALPYYGAGTLMTDSSGHITVSSDERLKNISGNFTRGLDDLEKIDPIVFHWNATSGLNENDTNIGFSAQNVQSAIPEAVGVDSRGYLTLQDRPILAASVNAIKQLASTTNQLSFATTSLSTQLSSLSSAFTAAQASSSLPHALAATSVTAQTMDIAEGVSAGSITTQTLAATGTVSAPRYVVPQTASVFTMGSSTMSAQLPDDVLASGGNVDLYKLASYGVASVQALATRTDLLAVKIDDLTTRVAALEALNAATSTDASDTAAGAVGYTVSAIEDAFKSLGIVLHKGYLALDSLVTHQLVLVKGDDGTSSTGSDVIPAGATSLTVTNPLVHTSSKIFLTFTSSVNGSWYLSEKKEGSFTIKLAEPQQADTEFDYFLLQTDANALAAAGATQPDQNTQPPAGSQEAPTVPPTSTVDGGPTVTLNGNAAVQIAQGASWTDPGATAKAADGTDLTGSIAKTGSVDASTAGTYTLTYSVTDAAGKQSSASRVVVVLAPTTGGSSDGSSTSGDSDTGTNGDSGTDTGAGDGSTQGTDGGSDTGSDGSTDSTGGTVVTTGGTETSGGDTSTSDAGSSDAGGSEDSSGGDTVTTTAGSSSNPPASPTS